MEIGSLFLPQGLDVVGTVGTSGEIRQVELNLIPSLIESHWHCANEWLYSGGWLIVRGSESSSNTLVIEYLYLEGEVLLQVLDDHDQEGKLDGKCLLWVKRSVDVVRGNIGAHNLKNWRLNIRICDSLDVTVPDTFVPNLQWLWSVVENKNRSIEFDWKSLMFKCKSYWVAWPSLVCIVSMMLTQWSREWKGNRSGMLSWTSLFIFTFNLLSILYFNFILQYLNLFSLLLEISYEFYYLLGAFLLLLVL